MLFASLFAISSQCIAANPSVTVKMYSTDEKHEEKGEVRFETSPGGLMIHPDLHHLPPGPHGFHIHENKRCGEKGLAAGGHFDPKRTGKHLGPYLSGHAGDLPVLYVNADGLSRASMLAPHLTLDDIRKRSVIIHASGDNYTDSPPLGGGGPRIICGVIP